MPKNPEKLAIDIEVTGFDGVEGKALFRASSIKHKEESLKGIQKELAPLLKLKARYESVKQGTWKESA